MSANVTTQTVHVVVLAAGRGSRLGALGDATPKWLLPVAGRPIADRQLEGLGLAGPAVASLSVVTGHAGDAIERFVARRADEVTLVPNPEFAELNNWWSLLRALRVLPADGAVVVLNADLCVAPDAVAAFVRDAAAGGDDGALAVDLERPVTDESMKVSRGPGGALGRIGKVGVDAPVGEYVGLFMARGPALRALRAELESFVGRDDAANEWYEAAIARTVAAGVDWRLWPMPSSRWVEIDDDADLETAHALVGDA